MIGKLKGVIDAYGEDFVIVDVHGVGYEVHCSARTLQVHKRRGSGFLEGVHFYQVTDNGIVVHPRIEAMLTDAQAVGTGDGM